MTLESVAGCDHIGLTTADADRLIPFYVKKLGFALVKEGTLSRAIVRPLLGLTSACRFVVLVLGRAKVELFEPTAMVVRKKLASQAGINHWGFTVGDKAAFAGQLRRRKVPVIEVVKDGRKIYFVKDPDGNRLELR